MAKDIGDVVARSILRHTALAFFTGGIGNIIAAVADVADVMDVMDAADAMDAYDLSDATDSDLYTSHSSDGGQLHFGSSQDVNTTQGPANVDDHGIVTTIPQSGTDVPKTVSPNDVYK